MLKVDAHYHVSVLDGFEHPGSIHLREGLFHALVRHCRDGWLRQCLGGKPRTRAECRSKSDSIRHFHAAERFADDRTTGSSPTNRDRKLHSC
jgi:hypothetical protein